MHSRWHARRDELLSRDPTSRSHAIYDLKLSRSTAHQACKLHARQRSSVREPMLTNTFRGEASARSIALGVLLSTGEVERRGSTLGCGVPSACGVEAAVEAEGDSCSAPPLTGVKPGGAGRSKRARVTGSMLESRRCERPCERPAKASDSSACFASHFSLRSLFSCLDTFLFSCSKWQNAHSLPFAHRPLAKKLHLWHSPMACFAEPTDGKASRLTLAGLPHTVGCLFSALSSKMQSDAPC